MFVKILRFVLAGIAAGSCGVPPLDFVEFFAGQQAVSNAMKDAALVAAVFELKLDPIGQNMLTDLGFANAMNLCLSLKPGAGCLMAPVCSTWTFMNRGTSKRSLACPYGNTAVQSVQEGNTMVARCVLLLLLLASRGCWWVLEQPQGSLMQEHPALQHLMSVMTVTTLHTDVPLWGLVQEKHLAVFEREMDMRGGPLQNLHPATLFNAAGNHVHQQGWQSYHHWKCRPEEFPALSGWLWTGDLQHVCGPLRPAERGCRSCDEHGHQVAEFGA